MFEKPPATSHKVYCNIHARGMNQGGGGWIYGMAGSSTDTSQIQGLFFRGTGMTLDSRIQIP